MGNDNSDLLSPAQIEKARQDIREQNEAARAVARRRRGVDPNPRCGIITAGEGGIWDYAKCLGVALVSVAPDDIEIGWHDGKFRIAATMATTQEAEAVREVIVIMTARLLKSHRIMIHADIYGQPAPKPAFRDAVASMFGEV